MNGDMNELELTGRAHTHVQQFKARFLRTSDLPRECPQLEVRVRSSGLSPNPVDLPRTLDHSGGGFPFL